MKYLTIFFIPFALAAADEGTLQRMFDGKLNATQRATACFELRVDRSADALNAMARALSDRDLRSCASTNLRVAGAVEELVKALSSEDAEVRATAARELGSFRKLELLYALNQAAEDENPLVASNGLDALREYDDPAVVPYLNTLATKGGMIGDMALDRLSQLAPTVSLRIARELLASGQVPDKIYALRVIGALGDSSDVPSLREIAASAQENLEQRNRGFGLMPAINIAKVANTAIQSIQSRQP